MNDKDMELGGFASAPVASVEIARAQADAVAVAKFEMAAMVEAAIARPRDENDCMRRLKVACGRPRFADDATWAFPRGGQQISGPSVQLARGIAQAWGNIRKGTRILAMDEENVHIGAFAHDVERGLLETAEAKIKKAVQRRNKQTQQTEWVKPDERDLRELINRHGAILERNCLLKIVPSDVIEMALDWCQHTLLAAEAGKLTKSREDTIRDLVLGFADMGVKREQIEQLLTHSIDTVTPDELVSLRNVFRSIRDGNTGVADHFEVGSSKPGPSGPVSTIKVDLSAATSIPPQDPAGGQAFNKNPEPVKPRHYKGIEIKIQEPPEKWLDEKVGGAMPLGGMTFRAAASMAPTDKAVRDVVGAMLDEGQELQKTKGETSLAHQRLAEACRLHDNAGLPGGAQSK